MRTASEYLEVIQAVKSYQSEGRPVYSETEVIEAIRQAQIDAIEECAEKAEIKKSREYTKHGLLETIVVDKNSILQLKNQVK